MKSIKAVIAGIAFIVVVGMTIQLAYIFMAVGYIKLAKSYPYLNEIDVYLKYIFGVPSFFLVMAMGGYITAMIAQTKVLLHSSIVGLITVSAMLASALYDYEITILGIVVFGLALISAVVGGWYWQRRQYT